MPATQVEASDFEEGVASISADDNFAADTCGPNCIPPAQIDASPPSESDFPSCVADTHTGPHRGMGSEAPQGHQPKGKHTPGMMCTVKQTELGQRICSPISSPHIFL